jgi:putative oxidoreductase
MTQMRERIETTYEQVAATKNQAWVRDVGLAVARIGLAWVFIYHGSYTLFGAFHGAGIHGASRFYAQVAGLRPGGFFAVLGGSIEFFGGIAVGLGIFGRLAAGGLVGDMCMAMITVSFGNGINGVSPTGIVKAGGGYELPLALASLAFVVAVLGTGRFSLDALTKTFWERGRGDNPESLAAP